MPFAKGQSGNPGGRPKEIVGLKQLAREHSTAAFKRILALTQSTDERVALAASQEVLNRAFGKPAQAHTGEDGEGPVQMVHRIERVIVGAPNAAD